MCNRTDSELLTLLLPEDFVNFGIIPELVGRLPRMARLRPLSLQELIHVLNHAEESELVRARRFFSEHGIQLELSECALEEVARRALEMGTGARALDAVISEALKPVDWRLPELAAEGVCRILISAEVIRGTAGPTFERRPTEGQEFKTLGNLQRAALEVSDVALAPGSREGFRGWPPERIQARIWVVRKELGYDEAPIEERLQWSEFEKQERKRPELILQVLEEIQKRGASFSEWMEAVERSGTRNIRAILHYLDYLILLKRLKES